jgi:hypothetical protein
VFLLPGVSFRCRRFRCSRETAIELKILELKVLLANKKLMFHSCSLRAWRIAHCAQEGEVEDVLSAGTIEEGDNKLGQAVTTLH